MGKAFQRFRRSTIEERGEVIALGRTVLLSYWDI